MFNYKWVVCFAVIIKHFRADEQTRVYCVPYILRFCPTYFLWKALLLAYNTNRSSLPNTSECVVFSNVFTLPVPLYETYLSKILDFSQYGTFLFKFVCFQLNFLKISGKNLYFLNSMHLSFIFEPRYCTSKLQNQKQRFHFDWFWQN